jgi:hypothetical protein
VLQRNKMPAVQLLLIVLGGYTAALERSPAPMDNPDPVFRNLVLPASPLKQPVAE